MPVPDTETLFRFIGWDDYTVETDGSPRVRGSLFNLSFPVSFNLESVWPLAHHQRIARQGGACARSRTASCEPRCARVVPTFLSCRIPLSWIRF